MGIFTDEEAFSTVVYRFLGGGVVQVSEKLDELDQDRYDMYKMVIPTSRRWRAALACGTSICPSIW